MSSYKLTKSAYLRKAVVEVVKRELLKAPQPDEEAKRTSLYR